MDRFLSLDNIKQSIAISLGSEQKKYRSSTKQKSRQKTIDQWSVNVPLQSSKIYIETPMQDQQETKIPFPQILDEFIKSISDHSYTKKNVYKVFTQAQKQSLKTLWQVEYTNKLSFVIYLLEQNLMRSKCGKNMTLSPGLENLSKHQENLQSQNINNAGNVQSEHQEQEVKAEGKKKKKIKKHKRAEITNQQSKSESLKLDNDHSDKIQKNSKHTKNNQKEQLIEVSNIQNNLLQNEVKGLVQDINHEIDRVETLYFYEMQQIHTLPYLEIQNKLQSNIKPSKMQAKCQSAQKLQNHNNHLFQQNSNNIFPLLGGMFQCKNQYTGINEQTNFGHPFMNFSYQMNNSQISPMSQGLGSMSMPYSQMTAPLSHISNQMNQMGHQQMINPHMFGNNSFGNNNFYDNNYLLYMNNFGQSNQTHPSKTQTSSQGSKTLIILENDQDGQ